MIYCASLYKKAMLEALSCQVDVAGNGEKALMMFENGYDAVILDVWLPEVSGFTTV